MQANHPLKPLCFQTFSASLVALALLATGLIGTTPAQAGDIDTSLDVMTFNIRFDSHNNAPSPDPRNWQTTGQTPRRDLVLGVIETAAPDILGVQEALANQVVDLTAGLPGYGFYGVGRNDGVSAGEHSGIFFRSDRFDLVEPGTFWLSETPDVPGSVFPGAATVRIASWVRLHDRATNEPLFVLNTHWDHVSQPAREHGAGLIRSHLDGLPDNLPVIVLGDLNVNENNAAYTTLVGDQPETALRDAYREVFPVRGIQEGTFNAFTGASFGARIDHVLHDGPWQATAAQIIRTDFAGRYPSDHYPVTATLTRVPEPGTAVPLALLSGAALSSKRK